MSPVGPFGEGVARDGYGGMAPMASYGGMAVAESAAELRRAAARGGGHVLSLGQVRARAWQGGAGGK